MLIEHFDTFLFDLDGVIYIGDTLLPGVEDVMVHIRREGRTVRFLTNDPRPTRQDVAAKLHRLGVEAAPAEIVTSGSATAAYIEEEGIETVYVVGSDGLRWEMEAVGAVVVEEHAEAVVVGCEVDVGYMDIAYATRHILKGARFVATNVDPSYPTPLGQAPGTGAIVSAVETASGMEPVVIGKPYPAMFDIALREIGKEGAVMIGDSMGSDIGGAHRAGIASILIAEKAPSLHHNHAPDVVLSSPAQLLEARSANLMQRMR